MSRNNALVKNTGEVENDSSFHISLFFSMKIKYNCYGLIQYFSTFLPL